MPSLITLLRKAFQPRRPRVSVVVPNYNYARYLEQRLATIDGQTWPVHEIIVLDDASTDDSVAVIEAQIPKLKAPTRLVRNAGNSGVVFRQWAKGAALASGELVWIAEADDLSDPEFLEHLVPRFGYLPLVMAYCQSRQIGLEGEVRMATYQSYLEEVDAHHWRTDYGCEGFVECAGPLAVMNTIPNVSACLFRREALIAALAAEAPDFGGLKVAGDWLIYLGVLAQGSLSYCSKPLNSHRFHDTSVTRSAVSATALVREVAMVQQQARQRFAVRPEFDAKARAYLQKLYDYFGVATPEYSRVYDHPDFAGLEE